MKYIIEYSLCCNKGKLRRKNQDNFLCDGDFLPVENNGLEKVKTGKLTSAEHPVLAVFDGMGGEQMGEYAAYIAASTLKEKIYGGDTDSKEALGQYCLDINRNICTFASENGIRSMGTTGCIINFADKQINLCNIGDSKIYHFDGSTMLQLSVDHCIKTSNGKAPLTQFLGVPEEEFIIQPYCTCAGYKKGDVFLICSDGLTDMADLQSIQRVLASGESMKDCAETLLTMALEAGGRDNITILLCRVRKKSLF